MPKNNPKIYKGKWKVLNQINSGGQGTVFKVVSLEDDKNYALKLFKIKKFQQKKFERARNEIEAIIKLNGNKNIIKIYDHNLDVVNDTVSDIFYVTDYAPYGSLKDNDFFIFDLEKSLLLFKEILIGVDSAHSQKIIHRDLKPENILLFPTQNEVIVSDFGISLIKDNEDKKNITDEGEIVGPVYFISPEQFKDPSKASIKSDIYSLGKILLFMITGKSKTFREEVGDLNSLFEGNSTYLPLIQKNLIERMVTEEPEDRFNSVDEVIGAVDDILHQMSTNNYRFVTKKIDSGWITDITIGKDRAKFIEDFKEDLSVHLILLEIALDDLKNKDQKNIAEGLVNEIKEKYKNKKTQVALDVVYTYVFHPNELLSKEKDSKHSFVFLYLSKYFFKNSSFEQAHNYILLALQNEKDPNIRLSYLLHFSRICKECKCANAHDFDKRLKELLNEPDSKLKRADMFRMLGKYYLETRNSKRGLQFLEASVNLDPDGSNRFDCGYQYSEIGQEELSLYHYKVALKNNSENQDVKNNLGVLFSNAPFSMPIKGMEMYEKSYELGNTLAGSNIASKYLEIGLKDKALGILRSIIRENKNGYDERVDEILGSVSRKVKEEEASEKKFQEVGAQINRYHLAFIDALTNSCSFEWDGFWEINSKYTIKITVKNGVLVTEEIDDSKFDVNGVVEGNCLEIEKCNLKAYKYASEESYTSGQIYLVSDEKMLGFLSRKNSSGLTEILEINGEKIKDIEKFLQKKQEGLGSLEKLVRSMSQNTPPLG